MQYKRFISQHERVQMQRRQKNVIFHSYAVIDVVISSQTDMGWKCDNHNYLTCYFSAIKTCYNFVVFSFLACNNEHYFLKYIRVIKLTKTIVVFFHSSRCNHCTLAHSITVRAHSNDFV